MQPVAALFQQVHHVAVPKGRVEPVDPHRERLVAPVHLVDGTHGIGARGVLVGGCDRILQVEDDRIRAAGGRPPVRKPGRPAKNKPEGRKPLARVPKQKATGRGRRKTVLVPR